jgi:nitrate reductase delta subunit
MNGELLLELADVLEYPGPDIGARCAELSRRLKDEHPAASQAMEEFAAAIEAMPAMALEEMYAATFDLNPVCCLYVGYHLFGESYKRGAFMANLNAGYRELGFDPGSELPDHLPVILRYLAVLEDAERESWLLEEAVLPALVKIRKALDSTDNVYGALVQCVLCALRPPGFVLPKDESRTLPVLGEVDHTCREWNDGKHV